MITVTAETWLSSSSLDDTWAALGRRDAYLCFPGVSPASNGGRSAPRGALRHELELPIVERQEQALRLSVSRKTAGSERHFAMRGPLVAIHGCWRLAPEPGGGVRATLTLDYDIGAALKEHAVNTLRSRSPLPIRTDADAILSRAVDEFFETRFAEHARDYCERVRARLDASARAALELERDALGKRPRS